VKLSLAGERSEGSGIGSSLPILRGWLVHVSWTFTATTSGQTTCAHISTLRYKVSDPFGSAAAAWFAGDPGLLMSRCLRVLYVVVEKWRKVFPENGPPKP
jgi:hypothetical protein